MTKGSSSFHIKKKKNGGNSTPACLALLQPSPPPPAPSLPVNSHNLSPSPLLESCLHHLVKLPLSVVLMGSAISGLADEAKGCSVPPSRTLLGDLPESCITSILKFLDPPEICRFACLNRAFRDASSADVVWESKLPPNYRFLVERVLGEDPRRMGKREIFSRLCRPNCFDGGTKEALLDKITGSICVAVSSTALKITGIDDRRYWSRIPSEESRFSTVAYLQQMWWVEVVGEFEFQLSPGTYSFYFRLQLGKTAKRFCRRTCDLNQVHGWDIKPVHFQLSTSNGQSIVSEHYLDKPGDWVQYHVGDFDVENQDSPIGIKFSMVQIDCTHTKGGLCVDCVLICPREG